MSKETRIESGTLLNMEPSELLEKLKHYFHHPTFKSDLQMNAIITILKRKCIGIIIYCYLHCWVKL